MVSTMSEGVRAGATIAGRLEPRSDPAAAVDSAVRVNQLAQRAISGLLLATVIVVPLIFHPTLDDGYALPKISTLRILGLVVATVFLAHVVRGGSLARNVVPWIDVPLAIFVGLTLAASVVSVDPLQSFAGEPYQYQGLVTVLLYVGSFYVARLSLGTSSGFRRVLIAVVGTGAVVSIYGIAQRLGVDPFWSGPPDDRIISSVGQPNDLAAYLDLVVIAAVGLWSTAGTGARIGLVVIVGVSLVALALTFSRGGYLGLIVALAVLLIPRLRALRSQPLGVATLGIATGVLLVSLAIPTVRSVAEGVGDRAMATFDLGEGSIRFHVDQWRVGTQVAIDHPWLGTGPETFPLVFRPYLGQVLPPDRAALLGGFRLESPHNEFIGIAAEVGLPATAAYVIFLIACAGTCIRRAGRADGASSSIALVVLAVLAAHVVTDFFKTPDVTTSEIFWITMGAGLAAMGGAARRPGEQSSGRPADQPQGAAAGAR